MYSKPRFTVSLKWGNTFKYLPLELYNTCRGHIIVTDSSSDIQLPTTDHRHSLQSDIKLHIWCGKRISMNHMFECLGFVDDKFYRHSKGVLEKNALCLRVHAFLCLKVSNFSEQLNETINDAILNKIIPLIIRIVYSVFTQFSIQFRSIR